MIVDVAITHFRNEGDRSGLDDIDGVSISAGDRILYAGGISDDIGIYAASAGSWRHLGRPKLVFVRYGTHWGRSAFFLNRSNIEYVRSF
jgi:hypothetical protein